MEFTVGTCLKCLLKLEAAVAKLDLCLNGCVCSSVSVSVSNQLIQHSTAQARQPFSASHIPSCSRQVKSFSISSRTLKSNSKRRQL